jgi:hypothetical protein
MYFWSYYRRQNGVVLGANKKEAPNFSAGDGKENTAKNRSEWSRNSRYS